MAILESVKQIFIQRRRWHFKSGQATANERSLVHVHGEGEGGSVHNRQCAAVKTTYEIKCVGAETGRSGRARRRQKAWTIINEIRIHAGQRRACVGHLAQPSRPQTVSAVWEWDQRPAEKWSGLGRTSRTGDAASACLDMVTDGSRTIRSNPNWCGGPLLIATSCPLHRQRKVLTIGGAPMMVRA